MARMEEFNFDALVKAIGEAGKRLSEIEASEGAAGNISVCVRGPLELGAHYSHVESVPLTMSVPELVGATFIVTGSGRRLREITEDPGGNLGCLVIAGRWSDREALHGARAALYKADERVQFAPGGAL